MSPRLHFTAKRVAYKLRLNEALCIQDEFMSSSNKKLVVIGLVAPAITTILLPLFGGFWLYVLTPVIYAFMCPVCMVALYCLHSLYGQYSSLKKFNLLIGVLIGALGGLVFYFLFFFNNSKLLSLAIDYGVIGIACGFITSVLYEWYVIRQDA